MDFDGNEFVRDRETPEYDGVIENGRKRFRNLMTGLFNEIDMKQREQVEKEESFRNQGTGKEDQEIPEKIEENTKENINDSSEEDIK